MFDCFAFAIRSRASSTRSSSTSERPTETPLAFKNVYAMPPPIRRLSIFGMRLLITPILSDTLAPPRIAANGR
jgi:hypothetical protein